jgi:hypothetical protein
MLLVGTIVLQRHPTAADSELLVDRPVAIVAVPAHANVPGAEGLRFRDWHQRGARESAKGNEKFFHGIQEGLLCHPY